MTTPLIEAIATALYDRDADAAGPDWIEYGGKVRERYREIAQAALTAITEAGYEISPEWLPRDRLEAAHDMLRWARAALDDGYRTERAKQEIAKIDQYFAAISAAQGDG